MTTSASEVTGELIRSRRLSSSIVVHDAAGKTFHLPPFLYLSIGVRGRRGDVLEIRRDESGMIASIRKIGLDDGFGGIRDVDVYPPYRYVDTAQCVPISLEVELRELSEVWELEEIKKLDRFHYLPTRSTWGRQSYLGLWSREARDDLGVRCDTLLGYLCLTSPGLLSSARHAVLGWNRTDRLTNVDRIARIARVVVHPEFRGLGLGQLLVRQALSYTEDRWNVAGKTAWYAESVAEMGRYHPVFIAGGMRAGGETAGLGEAELELDRKGLQDREQGRGHFRASIARYKQSIRAPKPYYIAAVHHATRQGLECKLGPPAHKSERDKMSPPCVRFIDVDFVPGLGNQDAVSRTVRVVNAGLAENSLNATRALHALKHLASSIAEAQDALNDASKHLPEFEPNGALVLARLSAYEAALDEVAGIQQVEASTALDMRTTAQAKLAEARELVESRLKTLTPGQGKKRELHRLRIRIQRALHRLAAPEVSARSEWVRAAFGDRAAEGPAVFKDLNLDLHPGTIALVTGTSGSGKSTYLNLLAGTSLPTSGVIEPAVRDAAWLTLDLPNSQPLIDVVGADLATGVEILNSVGLGEAALYLKRPLQLSHGQLYRAALAVMAASGKPLWLADEFCSTLDPLTAAVVSRAIRKLAHASGATVVVATARPDIVKEALQPDLIVRLGLGGQVDPTPRLVIWNRLPTPQWVLESLVSSPGTEDQTLIALGLAHRAPRMRIGEPSRVGSEIVQAHREGRIREAWQLLAEVLWKHDLAFHRLYSPPWLGLNSATPDDSFPGIAWRGNLRTRQLALRAEFVVEATQASSGSPAPTPVDTRQLLLDGLVPDATAEDLSPGGERR